MDDSSRETFEDLNALLRVADEQSSQRREKTYETLSSIMGIMEEIKNL